MTTLDHRPMTAALPAVPTPRLPASGEAGVVPSEVVRVVQDCIGSPVHNAPHMPPWAITDPDEIVRIAGRVEFYSRWWGRVLSRPLAYLPVALSLDRSSTPSPIAGVES